ncbi:MAG TPA: hypothetical protein VFP10_02135 [Candidatus Eisenbacteria bacterium]|nr:hypothetical protein [Candidatus Eisenbacteria bacterium]
MIKTFRTLLQPGRARYTLVVLVCSLLGVVSAGAAYTEVRIDRAEREIERQERLRDQEWCDLLAFLTQPPPANVHLDSRQRQTLALLEELEHKRGCPPDAVR